MYLYIINIYSFCWRVFLVQENPNILLEHRHPPSKWKEFLHERLVEGLGYVPGVCWKLHQLRLGETIPLLPPVAMVGETQGLSGLGQSSWWLEILKDFFFSWNTCGVWGWCCHVDWRPGSRELICTWSQKPWHAKLWNHNSYNASCFWVSLLVSSCTSAIFGSSG